MMLNEREQAIVNYLREYRSLCLKHMMFVQGIMGQVSSSDTGLTDYYNTYTEKDCTKQTFTEWLDREIWCAIQNLFAPDGNHMMSREKMEEIRRQTFKKEPE